MPHTIAKINEITIDMPALHYLIREPKVTSPKRKGIILLHGVGSNEQDLYGLTDFLPQDLFVVTTRAPFIIGPGRFAWYNVDFSTGRPVINTAQEASSREALVEFVAEIKKKYTLDEVYLGGFSQGAIMSYSVALTNPEAVDGVVAISGRILEDIQAAVPVRIEHKRLKVFAAHGVLDNTLPVSYAREARKCLENMGVNLRYHEYEIGHHINQDVLSDLRQWFLHLK